MSLLQMSFQGGVLILVTMALRAAALHRLPKGAFSALWGMALLRLLLPFKLASALSVYSLANRLAAAANSAPAAVPLPGVMPALPVGALPAAAAGAAAGPAGGAAPFWVWLAGAVGCGAFFGAAYLRCRAQFCTALPVEDAGLRAVLEGSGLRRRVRLRCSGRIKTPMTYGLLRPVILLPQTADWTDLPGLCLALEHELMHIRRLDALRKGLLLCAACVHWFNPLAWCMLLLAGRDMELCCDEAVVRRLGLGRRGEYARALLRMEEQKSGLPPLASAFAGNAAEERILAIMKTKKRSLAALLAALLLVCCVGVGFATTARAGSEPPRPGAPGGGFTKEELDWLAGLWMEGYNKLTVAEYQQAMWAGRDAPGRIALLDRYGWYLAGLTAEERAGLTAEEQAFAGYFETVYSPLTAEWWQKIAFSGGVGDTAENGSSVLLEYTCYLRIQDAERLTVGEYEQTRLAVQAALERLAAEQLAAGPSGLARQRGMQDVDLTDLERQLSTDQLAVSLKGGVLVWGFGPESAQPQDAQGQGRETPAGPAQPADAASGQSGQGQPEPAEQREYPRASRADYDDLFVAVKTEGWQQLPLAEFDQRLLDWANEHFEAYGRISCDAIWNDYGAELTAEEKRFVSLTCALSGTENGMRVRALHTGRPEESSGVSASLPSRMEEAGGGAAWCDLYYQLFYRVADPAAVTVAERDACVGGMLAEIERFWQDTSLDALLAMSEEEVAEEFRRWAAQNSTDGVRFEPVTAGDIHYEAMDERRVL